MKQQIEYPELPRLVPRPAFTAGVAEPVVSLNGTWKACFGGEMDKMLRDSNAAAWEDIAVPSSMSANRRVARGQRTAYVCRRSVAMQNDWQGKRLYLRFEAVNGFSEIYIDGTSIGGNQNPFLAFGFDITELVQGKRQFDLAVAVQEHLDKVSSFAVGGILRSVALYVLPQTHCDTLRVETRFDHQFCTAYVDVRYGLNQTGADTAVRATLLDPYGAVAATAALPAAQGENREGKATLRVDAPLPWDAEHPRLYTLQLEVETGGAAAQRLSQRVGLRQIDRAGNRLYVNGKEVKLRGACRHEVAPKNGRCLTPELIREDVRLFQEANCNYIRTSHYPPSEYFLDLCDEAGIYVEDELPLAFIARTLDYTQRDPAQTARYLSVFAQTYARDCNHPSVLMWSLCNESFGGYNFDVINRWAHETDPTRPTKFSYPMTIPEEHAPVDIWSIHYSEYTMDQAEKRDNVSVPGAPGKDMPVLHDEFVHVPCYNRGEHRRDPNIRNFWGEGLKRFWDKIWNTEGALGGAIWAGIDETDIFTGGGARLEWGIIDIWRRKKPEHYTTRKAYSPIVASLAAPDKNGQARLSIENRFCHTNLDEVMIHWRYGGQSGKLRGPFALPFHTASLTLPFAPLPGEELWLTFTDARDVQVDEYLLTPLPAAKLPEAAPCPAPTLSEDDDSITVAGQNFRLRFSKASCLVAEGAAAGETILVGGPCLHMPYYRLGAWQPHSIAARAAGNAVHVDIKGAYKDSAQISFALSIGGDGAIHTQYTVEKLLRALPHAEKLRVGIDGGGLDELGVSYLAAPGVDSLSWKRQGMHSWYPEDHIARNQGVASRFSAGSVFGEKPQIPWAGEMRSFILHGRYDVETRGTNDFRSLKPNILNAAVYAQNGKAALKALSCGEHHVRLEVENPEALVRYPGGEAVTMRGNWVPQEDLRGSRSGAEWWSDEVGAFMEFSFTGTGAVWYGPVDTVYGMAKVYVDGQLADARVDQRVAGVEFPGSAAGYDKKYDYPVFSVDGLPHGQHTLRIEVSGEKAPDAGAAYIVVDYFRILRKRGEEAVRFIVCNNYNYPQISWGNYVKPPILIEDGYADSVTVQLAGQNKEQ